MIYLDNASTGGFKPACVQNAVLASMKCCANAGRSGHRLSLALNERVLACREILNELFDGYGESRVVFTKSCTEALNLATAGVLNKGDHVITTALEHNSVLRSLERLKREGIIGYDVAPLSDGRLLPESIPPLLKSNTRMCCVTSASNVTGFSPDLRRIRSLLPDGVLLVVDGAQGAGHIPIAMRETGIDALALAGHKGLHALQGAGALLFSKRLSPRPILYGGTGSKPRSLTMPAYYPDALESGTLAYPAIASLFEGALLVKAKRAQFSQTLEKLTAAFHIAISAVKGFTAYSSPNPCGIAVFRKEGTDSAELARLLSERFDIAVRGGLHCAPLVHEALGTLEGGLVRASFSPFQSMREVNALVGSLKRLADA